MIQISITGYSTLNHWPCTIHYKVSIEWFACYFNFSFSKPLKCFLLSYKIENRLVLMSIEKFSYNLYCVSLADYFNDLSAEFKIVKALILIKLITK